MKDSKLYTVEDIAKQTGLTIKGVYSRLFKSGIKPFSYKASAAKSGRKVVINLYTEEQVKKISSRVKRDKKVKYYTTSDLMDISGFTRSGVFRRIKNTIGLNDREYDIVKTKNGNLIKVYKFTEEEVIKTGLLNVKETPKKETKEENLEELFKKYPYITDARYFQIDYFPDVTPNIPGWEEDL